MIDDALSAVDTDTEAQILDALKQRRGTQTTIIIAHRLSTVMHADRILVFKDGVIQQSGTHDDLSETPGIYRQLCEIQGAIQHDLELDLSRLEQPS